MNNILKRLLCLLLTLSLLMTVVVSASAVEDNMYTDTEKRDYSQSLEVFKHIDVFDIDGEINDVVTRGAYANMLVGFLGLGGVAESHVGYSRFNDTEGHKFSADIYVATEFELMDVPDSGLFRPNDNLLYEDAVHGIVCSLGYDYLAKEYGSNSVDGYMNIAHKIGILDGTDIKIGYYITYGEILRMFENALTIDIMVMEYNNKNNDVRYIASGATILNSVLKCEKNEGILTATPYTDLYGSGDVGEGSVKIDNTIYKYTLDTRDLLGHSVEYYTRVHDGESELVYVCDNYNVNEILTVDAKDIEDYSRRKYSYYNEKSKKKTITIPAGCAIIYNGSVVNDEPVNMKPSSGDVTFISNDGDNIFDVVLVTDYQTIVVKQYDQLNNIIYDKFDALKKIPLKDVEERFLTIIDTNGNKLRIDKIKQGDVLSVAVSADEKQVKIIVSSEKINGIADRKMNDKLLINDVWYELAQTNYEINNLKLGNIYDFYFNKDNELVYFEQGSAATEMAYLIDGVLEGVFDKKLRIKLCNNVAAIEILDCADKLYINDIKYDDHEKAFKALNNNGLVFNPQLTTLIRDEAGKLKKIYTVYTGNREDCPAERLQLGSTLTDGSHSYTKHSASFKDYKTFLSTTCSVFYIPTNPKNADESEFFVENMSSLEDNKTYCSTQAPAYTYLIGGDSILARCMVVNNSYYGSTTLAIVDDIARSLDDEDEVYTHIKLWSYSSSYDACVYSDSGIDINSISAMNTAISGNTYALDIGDVIYYSFKIKNGKRMVTSIKLLYDASSDTYLANNPINTSPSATSNYYMADVYCKDGSYVGLVVNGGNVNYVNAVPIASNYDISAPNYRVEDLSTAGFYKYDKNRNVSVLSSRSIEDIVDYRTSSTDYSRIIVLTSSGKANFCYIVK